MKSTIHKLISLLLVSIMFVNVLPTFAVQAAGTEYITEIENDFPTLDEWLATTYEDTPVMPTAKDIDFIAPTDGVIGLSSDLTPHYGSNGKFIAPIEPIEDKIGWTAISDRAGLEAMANNLSGKYYLTADIDLAGAEWGAIRAFTGIFDGQGYVIHNLNIIYTGTSSGSDLRVGLFTSINGGTIKNLGLEDTNISASRSGFTSVYAGGICGENINGIIYNCYNTGIVFASNNSSFTYVAAVGGICGTNENGFISNSYNTGIVLASAYDYTQAWAGGISSSGVGAVYNCFNKGNVTSSSEYRQSLAMGIGGGAISNCYNIGDVSAFSSAYVSTAEGIGGNANNCYNTGIVSASATSYYSAYAGGICGSGSGNISNCYNTGDVSSYSYYSAYAGGICGESDDYDNISNCYNTGDVSASASSPIFSSYFAYAGGICGYGYSTISNCYNTGDVSASASSSYSISSSSAYAGGICGESHGTISNCYNTGDVSASASTYYNHDASAGGIRGYGYGTVGNCYWSIDSIQKRDNVKLANANKKGVGSGTDNTTPLTSAQMRDPSSFVGFDFDTVWGFKDGANDGYPILRSVETGIVLNKLATTMKPGNTDKLIATAIYDPSILTNEHFSWSSSNPDIVAVDNLINKGELIAKGTGTAIITVTYDYDETLIAYCEVTVTVPVENITLDESEQISLGQSRPLSAIITPSDATNKKVTWSSSDTSVATVTADENDSLIGLVTGVAEGSATITVTTDDGGYTAKCEVTVKFIEEYTDPEKVKINNSDDPNYTITLPINTLGTLKATVEPLEAEYQSILWSSSNPEIATVSGNGFLTTILALSEGTTIVTATVVYSGGSIKASCTVKVKPLSPKVKIEPKEKYSYTDADGLIQFSWSTSGDGTPYIAISKNGELIDDSQTGNIIDITPVEVLSGLKDIYTIKVTVKNEYGDSGFDSVSFEVYKYNALKSELDFDINLDNYGDIANKLNTEGYGLITSMRSELTLTRDIQLDTSGFPWTDTDELIWQTEDDNIAEIYYQSSNGWVKVTSEKPIRPLTSMRIIGYENGETTITVTHKKTGMDVKIPITVNNLRNKLYLISVSPAVQAEVIYTNGNGEVIGADGKLTTNSNGEIAIYDESCIVGEVKFKAVSNGEVYFGSIDSSKLYSGEQGLQAYPINRVNLKKATNQTFYAYLPNGNPYDSEVTVYGGLYKGDDIYVSEITPQYIPNTGSGGSFDIKIDSSIFENVSPTDKLKLVYEVHFDNGYSPQLITVDGFISADKSIRLGDAILRLQEWDGAGFTAIQYIYENDGGKNDVTDSTAYVGMSGEYPTGVLTTSIVSKSSVSAESIGYVDEFGYMPNGTDFNLINGEMPFVSGIYKYYQIELSIDDELKLKPGETRRYLIHIWNDNNNLQKIDIPFSIINAAELVIPEDLLDFSFDPSGIIDISSILGSVLGDESTGAAALDVLQVITQNIKKATNDIPVDKDKSPFTIQVKQKKDHPLVFEVKGVFTQSLNKKNKDYEVYWAENGEGKATYKIHEDPMCPSLSRSHRMNGSVTDAIGAGILGGFCEICSAVSAQECEDDFEKAQKDYLSNKRGMSSSSSKISAYFIAEIGYDVYTEKFILKFTEVGASFKYNYDYQYNFIIRPVPAVPALVLTIGFAAGFGVEVGAKVLPGNIGSGNNDWLFLEAKVNAYLRLRGAAGVDIWIAAADIGVFGEVKLTAELLVQILDFTPADRYKIDGTIGIDTTWRLGPPVKILGKKLYKTGRTVLWEFVKKTTGYESLIWPENYKLFEKFNSGFQSSSATGLTAQFYFFNELIEQRLYNIPTVQLPADEPVIACENDNFAVVAWVSMGLTDEEWEQWDVLDDDRDWDELSESEQAELIKKSIEFSNNSEITVSVYKNDEWLEPLTLTDSYLTNVNPKVAVYGDKAVVIWQQMALSEEDSTMAASTELWYAIYDGGNWSEIQRINTSVNGTINDYSIAMNGSDIAMIMSVYDSESEDSMDNIYTIHINNAGQKTQVITQNRITFDANLNNSPQIARYGDGFIFSHYIDDYNGNNDVALGMLNEDGSVDYDFSHSIGAAAGVYGKFPSQNYCLIVKDDNVAIAWTAYDNETDGYAIYAMQLVESESNGTMLFTAPIELISPQAETMLSVLDGIIESDGSITVLYKQFGYDEYSKYLEDIGNPDIPDEELVEPGINQLAYGKFENDFLYTIYTSDEDAAPESVLPIYLTITNAGIDAINAITLRWNGGEKTWDDLDIKLCDVFSGTALIELGTTIENISYEVIVSFGNTTLTPKEGTLNIAKPDISIGKTTVTKSEQGKREFAVNLYNMSNVKLAGSENNIHLSFYRDPMLENQIHVDTVSGQTDVDSDGNIQINKDLFYLIDEGGLSVTFRYTLSADDLNEEGEIPSEGIRIFIKAEILDSHDNLAEESNYSYNQGNVLLESLLRYGQDSVIASVNQYNGIASIADISVLNRSMKDVSADKGRIIAHLLDENGDIIEAQTLTITDILQGEGMLNYNIKFSQTGYDVSVSYEALSADVNDSSLNSLKLSSIPFIYTETTISSENIADNVYNVETTKLTAVAKNTDAIIIINGTEYIGIATVDIPLQSKTVVINIVIKMGISSTTYKLVILSDKLNLGDLKKIIEEAKADLETAIVSVDGSDVEPGILWVTAVDIEIYEAAILAAVTMANDKNTTQNEVDAAFAVLNEAIKMFNAAKKDGKYKPPVVVMLVSATNAKFVSIVETSKNSRIWTLTFTVVLTYSDNSTKTVKYAINLNGNNANLDGTYKFGADHDLAGYTLVYDIKGNGSNVKEFKVIKK